MHTDQALSEISGERKMKNSVPLLSIDDTFNLAVGLESLLCHLRSLFFCTQLQLNSQPMLLDWREHLGDIVYCFLRTYMYVQLSIGRDQVINAHMLVLISCLSSAVIVIHTLRPLSWGVPLQSPSPAHLSCSHIKRSLFLLIHQLLYLTQFLDWQIFCTYIFLKDT